MNIRTGGLDSRRPAMSFPWPVLGGWSVYRSAARKVSIPLDRSHHWYLPLKLLSPSVVRRPPALMLYGLSSCKTLPTVRGYVNNLVACRMLLSSLIASKPRVYRNVSQLVRFTIISSNCGPGYSNSGNHLPERKSWSSSLI
jgi:hypothetical protein